MERNNLYPIFLKTSNLHILIVGGGKVAEEKLTFLTKSSPDAKVTMVSAMFRKATKELAAKFDVELITDFYHAKYLMGKPHHLERDFQPASKLILSDGEA